MNKLLIPLIILIGSSSCSNYYKAITATEPTKPASFNNFHDSAKYYILRNGNEAFAMKNISISNDQKNLQCTLETLPIDHKLHLTNGRDGKMKYRKPTNTYEDETAVLNEVHIYLKPGSKTESGVYTMALENIQKAEIIEKDKIKTRKSYALGRGIAIGSTVVVLGLIIGAVAVSSISFF